MSIEVSLVDLMYRPRGVCR